MHLITKAIADEVRVERLRRRKDQKDMAPIIGVSQDAYARREACKVAFSVVELYLIAESFGFKDADGNVDFARFFPSHMQDLSRVAA